MKTNVRYDSVGLQLAGHLYTPDDEANGPRPAIVVGHPGSGVKEQAAGLYAKRLAEHGFVSLAFDAAYQGESEGEPRGLEDPAHRVEDIKAAVSFLSVRDEVDPNRIGALGICASGGYVIPATATDHRIKVVATVSGVDMGRQFRNGGDGKQDPAIIQGMLDAAAAARTGEARGEGVGVFPIFPATEEQAQTGGQRPLLMIVGTDAVTSWMTTDAFANAQEPRDLFWVKGATHVALYDKDEYVTPAVSKLRDEQFSYVAKLVTLTHLYVELSLPLPAALRAAEADLR
jgi:hypothetical protein